MSDEGDRPEEREHAVGASRAEHLTMLGVFLLAFLLRGLYIAQAWAHPAVRLPVIDAQAYQRRALEILAGDWLGDAVYYLDPLYPFFLAGVYTVVPPGSVGVLVAQALLDSASVVLIILIARRVFGSQAALVAGLLAATYKPFFFYDALLLKAPLMIFLMVVALYFVTRAAEQEKARAWLPAGFFLGLAALTRGNSLLFAPVLGLWILLAGRGDLTRRFLAGVALALGLVGAILPVSARNYFVGDDLVLLNSQAGQNFYIGHFEGNDTGAYQAPPFLRPNPAFEESDFADEAERRAGRGMKPSEISNYWLQQGLEVIARDPARFLRHSFRKVLVLFNHYEIPDNASYEYFQREVSGMLRLPLPGYAFILPLSVAGLLLAWRRPLAQVLALFVFAYSAGIVLFFNLSRLRLPIVPVLIVFAGFAVVRFWESARAREWRPLAVPAAMALALVPVTQLDLVHQNLNVRYVNMGVGFLAESEARWQEGETLRGQGSETEAAAAYAESFEQRGHAEEQFRKALVHDPDYMRSRNALRRSMLTKAVLYEHLEDYPAALAAAVEVAETFDSFAPGFVVLGRVYEHVERPALARRAYHRALVLQPKQQKARERLEALEGAEAEGIEGSDANR